MLNHGEAVSQISAAVRTFHDRGQSFRIFHGSTNSTRPSHHEPVVDISALCNVLKVDKTARTATVEPNVPMDKLVRATLAHGMIPPVVMEFPGITVGGGYAGSAGESSSFKYGYFDQSILKTEMVLATGEIVTASDSENADLFKGAAGAMGTLGIITQLELKLIPAKHFVKLVYHSYPTAKQTISALREATTDPDNYYVDGVIYSKNHGVLMIGRLTDNLPTGIKPQVFSGPWDPWFYLHAKSKPTTQASVDYIPIAEYLFRYDRGGFWVGTEAFRYFGFVPFNKYTRWFLNDFVHTRMMYRALHASNLTFSLMIQDVSLPYDTVDDFIEYTSQNLDIWPLWLCPLHAIDPPTFHPSSQDPERGTPQPMLNVGLWGAASKDFDTFVRQNRDLEARLTALGGRKVLYSHTYYTKDEFWKLYDAEWYQKLREKYKATSLPTVYDKVNVDVVQQRELQNSTWTGKMASLWPFSGFLGIWHAIKSKDYLVHRNLDWMNWGLEYKNTSGGC